MTNRVTRLAPSPTGTLHLGNLRTFLINWALARNLGWKIVLRIEDLDAPRVRPGSDTQFLGVLNWLGIDFDEGPIWQSHDLEPHRQAMKNLAGGKLTYQCSRTRGEIQQAAAAVSAPHGGDREFRVPPEVRPKTSASFQFDCEDVNYRFVTPNDRVEIHDRVAGKSVHCPSEEVGDFIVWTKQGVPSYQLAVVVDDARQGVTDVVRGDDLLPSAARQVLLYRALGLPVPNWWHVPLVFGPDGRRLAKRHGDTHLDSYRLAGVRPQRLIGLMANWCGASAVRSELSAEEFRRCFNPDTLSRSPVMFSEDDQAWLTNG